MSQVRRPSVCLLGRDDGRRRPSPPVVCVRTHPAPPPARPPPSSHPIASWLEADKGRVRRSEKIWHVQYSGLQVILGSLRVRNERAPVIRESSTQQNYPYDREAGEYSSRKGFLEPGEFGRPLTLCTFTRLYLDHQMPSQVGVPCLRYLTHARFMVPLSNQVRGR